MLRESSIYNGNASSSINLGNFSDYGTAYDGNIRGIVDPNSLDPDNRIQENQDYTYYLGLSSVDLDTITQIVVDWGDSSTTTTTNDFKKNMSWTHQYSAGGIYDVSSIITFADGSELTIPPVQANIEVSIPVGVLVFSQTNTSTFISSPISYPLSDGDVLILDSTYQKFILSSSEIKENGDIYISSSNEPSFSWTTAKTVELTMNLPEDWKLVVPKSSGDAIVPVSMTGTDESTAANWVFTGSTANNNTSKVIIENTTGFSFLNTSLSGGGNYLIITEIKFII